MEMTPSPIIDTKLTDIVGLRHSGIFPKDKEPSIRTLRSWTKLRRIPHHEVDPENWTGRIDNPTIETRSPCPRNDVSIIRSSKPK